MELKVFQKRLYLCTVINFLGLIYLVDLYTFHEVVQDQIMYVGQTQNKHHTCVFMCRVN